MSLVTQAMIFEKYGPRLTTEQLAGVLGVSVKTLYNQITAGTLGVKTYLDAGKRWADYRDVAEYFDRVRELAA